MFRTKTAKRPNKKGGGPITPGAPTLHTVPTAPTAPTVAAAVAAVAAAPSVPDMLIDLNTLVPEVSGELASVVQEVVLASAPASAGAAAAAVDKTTSESRLFALLDAESQAAVHKPWLRLERGLRMRLLRAFVERQKDLTAVEKPELLAALVDALDKKLLNSKSQITYSPETGDIIEINALKTIVSGTSKKIFRIEPPNRSTKKAQRKGSESD
jgi:hypothetical protein